MESPTKKRCSTCTERLKLSYCYGGVASYEPKEVLGPRLLTDYEAVLIIEGFPIYESQKGSFSLEPGSILVAQPDSREIYHWDKKSRTRHAYLHFDLENIPARWPEPAEWPRIHIHPPAILGQLFRHMTERAVQHPDWPTKKPSDTDSQIFETLLDLFITTTNEAETQPRLILSEPVRRAAKFMRERLDSPHFEPFTLDELAATAHVTTKHLCRVFSNELGLSPIKAVRLMQFQLAIPLLARSNNSIKEVAERCGFEDQLYFSRSFSQAFGQSPSQIRKEMRQGSPPPANPLPTALTPRIYW